MRGSKAKAIHAYFQVRHVRQARLTRAQIRAFRKVVSK